MSNGRPIHKQLLVLRGALKTLRAEPSTTEGYVIAASPQWAAQVLACYDDESEEVLSTLYGLPVVSSPHLPEPLLITPTGGVFTFLKVSQC